MRYIFQLRQLSEGHHLLISGPNTVLIFPLSAFRCVRPVAVRHRPPSVSGVRRVPLHGVPVDGLAAVSAGVSATTARLVSVYNHTLTLKPVRSQSAGKLQSEA